MRERQVMVLPYDKIWAENFNVIKRRLLDGLKTLAIGIEHVGSTSVVGMSAKPIIDIDVVIQSPADFELVATRLLNDGYIHEGNLGIEGREAFKYTGKDNLPNHHLYVCHTHSVELLKHITFRDYLKNNPEAALEYSRIKEEAAEVFKNNKVRYMECKTKCIKKMYKDCGLL